MRKAEIGGRISGVKVVGRNQPITRILFVDDSLIFCRATLSDWHSVQNQLALYEVASAKVLTKIRLPFIF